MIAVSRRTMAAPTFVLISTAALALFVVGSRGVALTARAQVGESASIWIEGEDAVRSTFNQHGWYSGDGVRTDLFSPGTPGGRAGEWLAHYSTGGATAEAEYTLDVGVADSYTMWIRASAYQVRMWYRLDGGPGIDIDMESDRREYLNLIAPGIDIRFLAWIRVAELDLDASAHSLTIGVEGHPGRRGGSEVHGGIDALALTNTDWGPSGALQPRVRELPAGPDDWFPLTIPDNDAAVGSVTDASGLLHRPAGSKGPVRREGDDLVFGDGSPARFWGVNAHPPATEALMEAQADFLARHGINLVRLHPVQSVAGLLVLDPSSGERRLEPALLETLDLWFSILKSRGIYVAFSPFYPHVITEDDGYDPALFAELPDASTWYLPPGMSGKSSSGVVNIVPQLQDAEWDWLRQLLLHENAHTGIRYVNDPALATIEVHNEDSIFWHAPLNDLESGALPLHRSFVQREWAAWLQERYLSDADLLGAWGSAGSGSRPGDSLSNESMGIYGAWEMTADGPSRNLAEAARMGDFIHFLAERQREYFDRRGGRLRELGFEGVTISTAWQAGGAAAHLANVWTDESLDMIDRHRYFGGGEGGHNVRAGTVNAGSHLSRPGSGILGRGLEQVAERAFMLSEWNQNAPNEWKAEIAPLVAFYGFGLNGWDASTHFSADTAVRMGTGWPDERSYVTETPHYIGQFPVLARSILRGDISEGDVVAARRLRPRDIFLGIDALSHWTPSGGWAGESSDGGTLDTPSEVLAIGKVTLEIGDDVGRSERSDWDALWDRETGLIRSTTEELVWDSSDRIVTVDSPRTQGVIGFAGGKSFSLSDVEMRVETGFVSILVTSLDDRPIDASRHLLITAMARDRQTGARYSADGTRLENVGGPPLLMEPVKAQIRISGFTSPINARPLDALGVPQGNLVEASDEGWLTIDGRYRAFSYDVRRIIDPAPPTPTIVSSPTGGPLPTPESTAPTGERWRLALPLLEKGR